MMAQMNTGEPFTVEFVSFDKKRKTGGQLTTYTQCVKHQAGRVEPSEQTGEPRAESTEPKQHKAPNHDYHGTINVKTRDGSIRKLRTRLIVRFNNEEVSL